MILHEKPVDSIGGEKFDKVSTKFQPLKAGVKFTGKVRFQNLKEDELGLLLWSIRLNENSQMNVGKGKPYGYGRISVEVKDVKVMDYDLAYGNQGLNLTPFKTLDATDMNHYIETYKKKMGLFLSAESKKNITIDELPHIQEFFMIKDATMIPVDDKTKYMSLEKKEYQSRIRNKQALDTIRQVAKKK